MLALAIIRKVTPKGCILLSYRLIADNKLNELFQLEGDVLDVFSEDFRWVLALERTGFYNCPAFLLPNWQFKETKRIGNPITTMLYPIPFSKTWKEINEILSFCLALPIPKVIPFGKSESDFWTEKLRALYSKKKTSVT